MTSLNDLHDQVLDIQSRRLISVEPLSRSDQLQIIAIQVEIHKFRELRDISAHLGSASV